jgi:CheY-like chemotaxis protein
LFGCSGVSNVASLSFGLASHGSLFLGRWPEPSPSTIADWAGVSHPGECLTSLAGVGKDGFRLAGIARFAIPGSGDATGPLPCDAHDVPISCLIVDDNESFLHAAQVLLEREGLAVAGVTSTSDEAVRQVQALHPDVVLVDIFLGEESGLHLVQRLSETFPHDSLTVILISTHSRRDTAGLIASSSAHGFLPKAELSAAAIRALVEADGHRGT